MVKLRGYARISRFDDVGEGIARQKLLDAGCSLEAIVIERGSWSEEQTAWKELIGRMAAGNELIIPSIGMLGPSPAAILFQLIIIADKGVSCRLLDQGIHLQSPRGEYLLEDLRHIAFVEKTSLYERQREGIERAKADGKYKGRTPTAQMRRNEVLELRDRGMTIAKIAVEIGISESSVYQIIKSRSATGSLTGSTEAES